MAMLVGFADADITPELGSGMDTVGFGQLETPQCSGIETHLFARAVSITVEDTKSLTITIVVCDCLVIPDAMNDRLVKHARETWNTELTLCATHTHSAPIVQSLFGMSVSKETDWTEMVQAGVIDAVERSLAARRSAKLEARSSSLGGWAFNRRFIMCDGNIETHPLKGDPCIVEPEGPDSESIKVLLAIDTQTTMPMGVVVVFGCHPTVMERRNTLISADFPGKVVKHVESALEGEVPVLFLQGPSGNICPVNPLAENVCELGATWTKTMGDAIGSKAVDVIRQIQRSLQGRNSVMQDPAAMLCKNRLLHIARRRPDAKLVQWARKTQARFKAVPEEPANETATLPLAKKLKAVENPVLSDYGIEHFGCCCAPKVSLECLFKTEWWSKFYSNEILTLEADCESEPFVSFSVKVVAHKCGDNSWALVALPCELFVELGDTITNQSPFAVTSIVTLANGYHGYIPTSKAFERRGGYETKELTSTKLEPTAAESVVFCALELLREAHTELFAH